MKILTLPLIYELFRLIFFIFSKSSACFISKIQRFAEKNRSSVTFYVSGSSFPPGAFIFKYRRFFIEL